MGVERESRQPIKWCGSIDCTIIVEEIGSNIMYIHVHVTDDGVGVAQVM